MSEAIEPLRNARHLAARAVMAYRAEFPITLLSNAPQRSSTSGIVCDWTQLRDVFRNDDILIRRGFAFIYMGIVLDQSLTQPIPDELRNQVAHDQNSAIEARHVAVDWGLAPSVNDTNPFAHSGYKLASRLLRLDQALINSLAQELFARKTMSEAELETWFKDHAKPLSMQELEATTTF